MVMKERIYGTTIRIINQILKYLLLFNLGGISYYYIEVLFRGYSHWSMYVLGAICFLFCSIQNEQRYWDAPLWKQVIRCTVFVLCGEFITGCIVNLWLGWNVWDYSMEPFNLLGQICFKMAFLFAGLCLVAIVMDDVIRWLVFEEEEPEYLHKIFDSILILVGTNKKRL